MAANRRQIFITIFLIIFFVNFVESFQEAVRSGSWQTVVGQLLLLLGIASLAWRYRGGFLQSREVYRRRVEESHDTLSVKDAALFSLSWSREIYQNIPDDRKRLVKNAFVLIGIAMAVVLLQIGLNEILTLLVIATLILAGVNLLVWVFSTERGERDRLRIELDTARQMQLSLMPSSPPDVPGLDVAGLCVPARDVGGDVYDFVWLGNRRERFGLAVVDVSGKGMDAAMTAVFTNGAFASEALHASDIGSIMTKLNSAIRSRGNRTRFVSFLLATIDPVTRKAAFINAGQTKPMLYRNGGTSVLEAGGVHFPLGLVETVTYVETPLALAPGDTLLLYTDGMSEAMNPAREVYGEERLRAGFTDLCSRRLNAEQMVAALRDAVSAWTGSADQHDDLTIVVLRVPDDAPVHETAASLN